MVEQAAVNRKVVSSSLTPGAINNIEPHEREAQFAGVAELADAQDLKSCDPYRSYRFDPGLRHQYISAQLGYIFLSRGRAAGSSSGS